MAVNLCSRCKANPRQGNHSYCMPCRREVAAWYRSPEYVFARDRRQLERAAITTKVCTMCHLEKRLADFYTAKGVPLPRCKLCHRQVLAEAFEADPDRVRGVKRRSRWRQVLQMYGLDDAGWDALVLAAEGRCDICHRPQKSLQIDHNHTTGEIRGLLCGECNKALGLFRDDPATLRSALAYLEDA